MALEGLTNGLVGSLFCSLTTPDPDMAPALQDAFNEAGSEARSFLRAYGHLVDHPKRLTTCALNLGGTINWGAQPGPPKPRQPQTY